MTRIIGIIIFVLIVIVLFKILWRAAIALLFLGLMYYIYKIFIADK